MRIFALCVSIFSLFLISSCDNSPTKPADVVTFSVSGEVILIPRDSAVADDDVGMRLSGSELELVAPVEENGRFAFGSVPNGDYQMTPVLDGFVFDPPSRQLTVAGGDAEAGLYYGGRLEEGEYIIAGQAVDSRNMPLPDITVVIRSSEGRYSVITGDDGYFIISRDGAGPLQHGGAYVLSAFRSGNSFRGSNADGYSLSPDSIAVSIDSRITICDFNYDEPLYSVSGRVVDSNGVDMENVEVYLRSSGPSRVTYNLTLGQDGRYEISGLPDGVYRFYFPNSIFMPNYYHFESFSNTEIVIDGANVEAGDMYSYYDGPTFYRLNGRIVDTTGAGIQDVIVEVDGLLYLLSSTFTKMDGTFSCRIPVNPGSTEPLEVSFRKQGFFFDPAGFHAGEVSWLDGRRDGHVMEAPPIIGFNGSLYDAGVYFPLAVGNSWTYRSSLPDDVLEERTIEITETNDIGGNVWLTTSALGPGNYRNFRVAGNIIHALDREENDITLLRFGQPVDSEWLIRRESEKYDHVGSYRGAETVAVPAGEYTDCEVFTIRIVYGPSTSETTTLWFARDVGMVKLESVITSGGEVIDSRTDELVSYQVR